MFGNSAAPKMWEEQAAIGHALIISFSYVINSSSSLTIFLEDLRIATFLTFRINCVSVPCLGFMLFCKLARSLLSTCKLLSFYSMQQARTRECHTHACACTGPPSWSPSHFSLPGLEHLLGASLLLLILLFLWQNYADFHPQSVALGRQNIPCILFHVWCSVRKKEPWATLKCQLEHVLHSQRHSAPGRNHSPVVLTCGRRL